MEAILHTRDIDDALEATAGVVLYPDTVAIHYPVTGMYGIYVKANESRWDLIMSSLNIESLMESK